MSVEEVRNLIAEEIRERQRIIHGEWSCGADGVCETRTDLEAAALLDRLILEVRASAPCYRSGTWTDTCRGIPDGLPYDPFAGDEPLCPPCIARAELQQVAEAV